MMSLPQLIRKVFSKEKILNSSVIPISIRNAMTGPIEGDDYPKKCKCGGSTFNLTHTNDQQMQQCPECKQKYTSRLANAVTQGRCPDCGGPLFEGPSGGAALTIFCKSNHRFLFSNFMGHVIVSRV